MLFIPCLALAALSAGGPVTTVPLHDFADPSIWKLNPDGGLPSVVTPDPSAPSGHGLRIRYVDGPPHWSNQAAPCAAPANATAIRFRLIKHSSAPNAAMHLILVEPDGDIWVQQVTVRGKTVGALAPGSYVVRAPIGQFGFDGRGNRRRELTHATKMLIGCNYGNLDVTVDAMVWEVADAMREQKLPRSASFRPEKGRRGNVAVLDMGSSLPTAHPPARLASALREAGFGVTILQAGDLADPQRLSPDIFDAVALPYGPYFPVRARDAFLGYLKAGGSFLATDGYAFDRPVEWTGTGWAEADASITAQQMTAPGSGSVRMNTRYGQPGDAMSFAPDQIGVFDPAFPLDDVATGRATGIYASASVRYTFRKPPQGFAAVALLGDNNPVFPPVYRRWIPVVEAFDAAGGGRGALLSLVANTAGVFKGSAWAISGVTSGDDLLLGSPARKKLLARVMDRLVERVFLHGLAADRACYRAGDTVRIGVTVTNFGRRPFSGSVVLRVGERSEPPVTVSLPAGASQRMAVTVRAAAAPDYVPLQATLRRGAEAVDRADAAYTVWNAALVARGPKAAWVDNRLSLDGQPVFFVGTNQTGMMFYSEAENPAVWERDFRAMAAHHVRILRILHFSPFAKDGYKGEAANAPADLANRPERLCAQLDAIVQLAARHGIVVFLTLHDWMGVGLTDRELAEQRDWCRFWAARYRGAPNVIFDVQNEPSVDMPDRPDIRALWNDWLRGKYGSMEALARAWRVNPPEADLPDIPFGSRSNDWYDVRSADLKRFESVLLNRWIKANVEGVKEGNPDAVVTVGFLPSMPPADKILGTRDTVFSNMHFYGSLRDYPLELKLIDRRAYGKGFSLGEFGSEEAHHARTSGATGMPVEESARRFSQVVHYAAGLGASFVCNWDWKELDEMVFPWGLVQRETATPKPWLNTYAQEAAFLSHFPLAQQPPDLSLFVPDTHRIGPRFDEIHAALRRAISLLLDQNVSFDVVNEEDRARLASRAVLAPIPYCLSDGAPDLLEWVRAGGALYVSGDLAFDAARQPTRAARQAALGLPPSPGVSPFDVPDALWSRSPVEAEVGKGRVLFVPYPLELRPREGDAAIYHRFITMAGIEPIAMEAGGKPVRAMRVPRKGGGTLYSLVRTDEGEDLARVTLPIAGVTVELKGGGCAFVVTDQAGAVVAAESQGAIVVGGVRVSSAEGMYGLVAEDGRALTRSQRLLVLPHLNRAITLAGRRGAPDWSWRIYRMADPGRATTMRGSSARFVPGQVALVTPDRGGSPRR